MSPYIAAPWILWVLLGFKAFIHVPQLFSNYQRVKPDLFLDLMKICLLDLYPTLPSSTDYTYSAIAQTFQVPLRKVTRVILPKMMLGLLTYLTGNWKIWKIRTIRSYKSPNPSLE